MILTDCVQNTRQLATWGIKIFDEHHIVTVLIVDQFIDEPFLPAACRSRLVFYTRFGSCALLETTSI